MLPKFLRSSYKEYKADSDLVIDWLAKTAQKCGFSAEYLHKNVIPTGKSQSSSRVPRDSVKTKQRFQNQTSVDNGTDPTEPQPEPKWEIAITDLVKLANYIIKAEPKVEIPLYLWSTLRKAIKERRRHNEWHERRQHDGSRSQRANEGHGHFIGILERISTLLEPLYARSSTRLDENSTTADPLVADAEPSPEQQEQIEQEIRIAGKSIDYTIVQSFEELEEEAIFAWECLIMDYHPLKQYVNVLWMAYKNGDFGLAEVSVVTNTAIDFAKHLDEEFSSDFPLFKPKDIESCFSGRFQRYLDAVAKKPVDRHTVTEDLIFAAYEAAGFSFLPTQMQLLGFCEILKQGGIPPTIPPSFDGYDSSSSRADKSAEEKHVEDRTIFHETLMELLMLASVKDRPFAEDQITKAIRDLTNNKELSMWLIFAFQIFLDIHHILRDDISKGYQDLQKQAKHAQIGIKQALNYYGSIKEENDLPMDRDLLKHILKATDQWVDSDIVAFMRSNTITRLYPNLAVPPPFFLLKRHPLRCGLMAYSIQISSQTHAIDLANNRGSILFAAHLYNCLRQEGMVTATWKDLNLALYLHKTDALFAGSFPKTATDCFKHYLLAIGAVSATDFARDKRKKSERLARSKNGMRTLNRISSVSMEFWHGYCQPREQASYSPDDIEQILRRASGAKVKGDTLNLSDKLEKSTQRYQDHVASSKGQEKYDIKLRQTFKARSVLLLDSLLRAVRSEKLELSFNHFRLGVSCSRLLRAVEQAVGDDLRERYNIEASAEKEIPPPYMVEMLIAQALDNEKLAKSLRIDKKAIDPSEILAKAAKVVESFLKSGAGEIECIMLKSQGLETDVPDVLNID